MSTVQTKREVSLEEVQHALSDELGPHFHVKVNPPSTLTVGRTGVIPTKVVMSRRGDTTTFKISTTGLILSRLAQATSINPRVKRALQHACSDSATTE